MANTLSQKQLAFCRAFVRTRSPREASVAAGFLLFPEKAAEKLLSAKPVQAKIQELEQSLSVQRAELIAGYRRLAFGSVADAVRLLQQTDQDAPPDPDTLDLFTVSEIKRPKGGGLEIKFFDRQKALDRLAELQETAEDCALPFYKALERSAAAIGKNGDEG